MNLYTFHREDGFYPISMPHHPDKTSDQVALDCVPLNPGTRKVVNEITKEVIYDETEQPNDVVKQIPKP